MNNNIIGIYLGSFQPPTKGDLKAYLFLKQITEDNTFVATPDLVDLPDSPLNFQDKQQIWVRHGVSFDKVVKAKDPYGAIDAIKKYGIDRTTVILAMSEKNANNVLKTGKGYFLPFNGLDNQLESFDKNAYILTIPDSLLNTQNTSNTTIRKLFGSDKLSDEQKQTIFKQIFGWYDIGLFELISKKFSEANTVKERINENMDNKDNIGVLRRILRPFIKEVLGQMSQPQVDTATSTSSTVATEPVMTPAEIQKDKQEKEKQRNDNLKQKEVELQTAKKEREFQKQKVDLSNRFTVPNITKDIQRLKGAKI